MSIFGKLRQQRDDNAVTITTTPASEGCWNSLECGTNADALDVSANGVFFATLCGKCVTDVPGYSGGLKLDDIIPNSWEAVTAGDSVIQRLDVATQEEAERITRSFWGPDMAGLKFRPTTARSLFEL